MEKEIIAFAKKTRKRFPPPKRARKPALKEKLTKLPGTKLILVDLYGTVFVANQHSKSKQFKRLRLKGFRETIKEFGLKHCLKKLNSRKRPAILLEEMFFTEILKEHERKRAKGAISPEVRAEKIWERLLKKLFKQCGKPLPKNLPLIALKASYLSSWIREPCAIYKGFLKTVLQLKKKGIKAGIASNSQLYSKISLDLGLRENSRGMMRKWQQLFEPGFSAFSFEIGESKPSKKLFEKILKNAKKQGIKRNEIAFIGNDLYKDIAVGKEQGFKTILFAGDTKSLRLRKGDKGVKGTKPDAIITEWRQLLEVVG